MNPKVTPPTSIAPVTPSDLLGEALLKRLIKIIILYQASAVALIGIWIMVTWNDSDWTLLGVPQVVLEWSLIGAIAGAQFRLSSYLKLTIEERASLYIWLIAKPFVGTAFGGVIYFTAVGGMLILKGDPKIDHEEILAALGFLAAFSDRFALSTLDRLSLSSGSK